ncbi:MAG TPA: zinc-binding alcohol dehydrogenase family protein [Acidimicrobiales bacterium]|nr:zinc-binding alcohol dehydrogenase family protein [Acidimicrobiales bacterium]
MKAAVYYQTGGPDVFRYEDVPDPVAHSDHVLVKVEAVSIEGGDTLSRSRGDLFAVPHIVGYQCGGTVIETGPKVLGLAVGDRVVTTGLDGSHAELRSVPEGFCWKLPDSVTTEDGACIPVAYGTAHDCLFEFGRLEEGQSVLVQAGASGVGIAAIQMAKRAGARVLATASLDDKLERLKALGLDAGVNYTTSDMVSEVRRLTAGQGVNLVLESLGGTNLQASLDCLAYRGRCVSIGDAGRSGTTTIDTSVMRPNNLTLSGYFLGMELLMSPRARTMIAGLIEDLAAGRLKVLIDKRFSLSQAAEAHAYIESRQAFGRVLLVP